MKNVPRKIFLQISDDCQIDENTNFSELHGVSWCDSRVNNNDIEYVLFLQTEFIDRKEILQKSLEATELFFKEHPEEVKEIMKKLDKVEFEGPTVEEYLNLVYPKYSRMDMINAFNSGKANLINTLNDPNTFCNANEYIAHVDKEYEKRGINRDDSDE